MTTSRSDVGVSKLGSLGDRLLGIARGSDKHAFVGTDAC
jgi:hypothetical protein